MRGRGVNIGGEADKLLGGRELIIYLYLFRVEHGAQYIVGHQKLADE